MNNCGGKSTRERAFSLECGSGRGGGRTARRRRFPRPQKNFCVINRTDLSEPPLCGGEASQKTTRRRRAPRLLSTFGEKDFAAARYFYLNMWIKFDRIEASCGVYPQISRRPPPKAILSTGSRGNPRLLLFLSLCGKGRKRPGRRTQ